MTKVSVLEDPVLGPLVWNEELGWFEGHTACGAETCAVQVSVEDDDDPHGSLGHALSAIKGARSRVSEFRSEAATRLLSLYNDEWRDDDATPKSAEEFGACLGMESITGYPDGSLEVSFTDGDLFAGHLILVSVEDGAVSDVNIAG